MIARFLLLGLRYPAPVLFLVVLTTLAAAAGLRHLEVDTSFASLLPADDAERSIYERAVREFGSDDQTVVYVGDEALWTPERLAALDELRRELAAVEGVARVRSLFDLRTVSGSRDAVETVPVLDSLPSSPEEALEARERALGNPLFVGNFVSADGSAAAIVLSLDRADDPGASREVFAATEAILADHRDAFDRLFQVGAARVDAELRASLYRDFAVLGPLSALVLVVAIWLFLRSGFAALLPLASSAVTLVWTFGLLGWLGVPLNILSAMVPSLVIVIGATEDTHLMAAYFRALEAGGGRAARRRAVRYMTRRTGLPLVLTVVTTSLGFGANLFVEVALIREFAIAATAAMLANGLATALLVPMILAAAGPSRPPRRFERGRVRLPQRIVEVFRGARERQPLNVLAVTAALAVFFGWQASTLHATNDPLSYFPSDHELVQDTRRMSEDLAGVKVFYVALEAEQDKGFLEPENVARLAAIQRFMERQGVWDSTLSLADHLAFVHRELGGDYATAELPRRRDLIAQYLLFFHRDDLASYVGHDQRRANIVVRHAVDDSHTLERYVDELREALPELAGPSLQATVVGENLMVNLAAEQLMVGQVQALGLLLALIFVIMAVMFTSLKGGLVALVPAVIPVVLMFGLMGLAGVPLNPGTAMVAVVAVGLAVDGTIHLLARYNELCRRTSDNVAAVNAAVAEEATPLVASSLALALGFAVLWFSDFTIVAQFGVLAAATMIFAIVANLLVAPIIIARVRLVGLYQFLDVPGKRVLESSPLFAGMSGYERRKAVLISELDEFEAGQRLVEQGRIGRSMFLILEGRAEVVRHDGGSSRVLAQLEPGAVFGEIGYIRAIERTADVRAATRVSALRFDYDRLQHDLKFFPSIVARLNFNISAILGERLAGLLDESARRESSPG